MKLDVYILVGIAFLIMAVTAWIIQPEYWFDYCLWIGCALYIIFKRIA